MHRYAPVVDGFVADRFNPDSRQIIGARTKEPFLQVACWRGCEQRWPTLARLAPFSRAAKRVLQDDESSTRAEPNASASHHQL